MHRTQTRTLGRYETIQLAADRTVHPTLLGPGNPNVHKEVGYPRVINQLEGIDVSHVRLVGKGLDSAVP